MLENKIGWCERVLVVDGTGIVLDGGFSNFVWRGEIVGYEVVIMCRCGLEFLCRECLYVLRDINKLDVFEESKED